MSFTVETAVATCEDCCQVAKAKGDDANLARLTECKAKLKQCCGTDAQAINWGNLAALIPVLLSIIQSLLGPHPVVPPIPPVPPAPTPSISAG